MYIKINETFEVNLTYHCIGSGNDSHSGCMFPNDQLQHSTNLYYSFKIVKKLITKNDNLLIIVKFLI